MSFQHFRLGDLALHQPLQHNIHPNPITTFSVSLKKQPQQPPQQSQPPQPPQNTKQPYGSGDADDGYTLEFTNLQEFNEWRQGEEERTMCEFVKGDTHGSKAVPPRFKDHTKLVCARHSRSGRKKYVKKHPERVRKVPSRKLEVGCPASISYKTYFDTEQVRACYISQHSHEIGLANLPYTRRGRREAAMRTEKEKTKPTSTQKQESAAASATTSLPSASSSTNAPNEQSNAPSTTVSPQPAPAVTTSAMTPYTTAVPMLEPLPSPNTYTVSSPPTYAYATPAPQQPAYPQPVPAPTTNLANERWENMATLFQSIRDHARNFEYPSPSVAALESILIRLYLESPVGVSPQTANMSSMMTTIMAHARSGANNSTTVQAGPSGMGGPPNDVTNGSTTADDGR
ncbi:hypothetical protein P691DRAFT_717884 [Macrolepiota fuliginosa MF-IS2]|uniref:Uncharacterized protein n=1 Tax=Macrolepiota fuliginosa MF-IS2 TaxID=1400762 RepID=A0A9P5XRL6_9AGAR|nr:hypothetical protein P691DRAFT_717884 [Macrolepiota fuliginosa MF-IS2]